MVKVKLHHAVFAVLALALLVLVLVGCTTPGGSFCRVMSDANGQPILRPTPDDVGAMSDQLVNGLLTVFETGADQCGWKPA